MVTNICSSRTIDDVVSRHGDVLEKGKVGQANVIDMMRSTGAVAAGEGSGSVTIHGMNGFDGFLMAGLLLEAIARRRIPLSSQVAALPRYEMVKQTIPCDSPHAYLLLRRLRDEFDDEAEVNDCDGLRFDWPDGFLSLRLSSTEGSLRLISEARSRETAQERAWRARLLWERLSS